MDLRAVGVCCAFAVTAVAQSDRPAEQVFKNIKVLKGVSRTGFLDSMRYMSVALGTGCNGCHVEKDGHMAPELDDKKEKQTARRMIEMTLAMNKNYFDGRQEVGCATCHHGREHPDRFLPLDFGAARAARPEKAPAGVTVAQILAKYVDQLGGEELIRNFGTRVDAGTLTRENGEAAPLEASRKAPDAYALSSGPMREGLDGARGWVGRRDADGLELKRLRRDAEIFPAVDIAARFPGATVAEVDRVGERKAYVVAGRGDGEFARYYFDTENGLLLRRLIVHRTAVGDMPEQTDYSDYRKVDGVQVPFTVTRQEMGARWMERYSEVRLGVPVDQAKFRKP